MIGLYILGMTLLGGFTGWSTNWIAIQMLFRPYHPWYIGKWRVPLTPGVLPRERVHLSQKTTEAVMSLIDPASLPTQSRVEDIVTLTYGMLNNYFDQAPLPIRMTPPKIRREIYLSLMTHLLGNLPYVLESTNLDQLITHRINLITNAEVEQAVREFADVQLRWITRLGALLGALIGLAQGGIGAVLLH